MNDHSISSILSNGIIGVTSGMLAIITTFQEQFEWWIRNTGGVLALLVAAVSLYRLIRRPKP